MGMDVVMGYRQQRDLARSNPNCYTRPLDQLDGVLTDGLQTLQNLCERIE